MELIPLSREQFKTIYDSLKVSTTIDESSLFDAYLFCIDGAKDLLESNILGREMPVNSIVLLLYLISEIGFYMECYNVSCDEAVKDEDVLNKIVTITLDKYFTNEHLNFKKDHYISKFSPLISTFDIYLNFVLGTLKNYRKNKPNETLLIDIIYKGFSISKAILDLVVDGFETEAFSQWRTLHEVECILTILDTYGQNTVEAYLKHIKYSIAYRSGLKTKDQTDKVFEQIKFEMKQLELKSKDMKKYIEYGWLASIPDYNKNPDFKFNFRDGVERLANLSQYSKSYEMASEIAHSSPLLIYSKDDYYFHLTILLMFESFFRLEKIFTNMYLKLINDNEKQRYFAMRNIYYKGLEMLYEKEKSLFPKD